VPTTWGSGAEWPGQGRDTVIDAVQHPDGLRRSWSVVRNDLRRAVAQELRRVRHERHLTLDDVRGLSGGRFKPSLLGSYERGERGVSLARFCELARLYRVPPDRLLADVLRVMDEPSGSQVVVDLTRLSASSDPGARLVTAFVHDIRSRRGDYRSPIITLRSGDLDALAGTAGLRGSDLLERLPAALRSGGSRSDRRTPSH
jgi:transcriptional regulator with XRE-family HTH domain